MSKMDGLKLWMAKQGNKLGRAAKDVALGKQVGSEISPSGVVKEFRSGGLKKKILDNPKTAAAGAAIGAGVAAKGALDDDDDDDIVKKLRKKFDI